MRTIGSSSEKLRKRQYEGGDKQRLRERENKIKNKIMKKKRNCVRVCKYAKSEEGGGGGKSAEDYKGKLEYGINTLPISRDCFVERCYHIRGMEFKFSNLP